MSLLITAAFEPELSALRRQLPDYSNVRLKAVGVGMAEAAAGTAKLLAESPRDSKLLFIGSCGAVDPDTPIYTAVSASEVKLADAALCSEDGYLPEPMPSSYSPDPELCQMIDKALSGGGGEEEELVFEPVYSPTSITRNPNLAQRYQKMCEARFENLELFGIAAAAEKRQIPWASLSLVTNTVGPEGQAQWKENHESAAEKTAILVRKLLKSLA